MSMDRDMALQISEALQAAHIGHTVTFGWSEKLAPPEHWHVQPTGHFGLDAAQIRTCLAIAEELGLDFSLSGTFGANFTIPPAYPRP